jgi:hypothetical protein
VHPQHAREIRKQLRGLARAAGADNPTRLGDAILLIIDGIYASGAVLGPSGPAHLGVSLAKQLIAEHCRPLDDHHTPKTARRRGASAPA